MLILTIALIVTYVAMGFVARYGQYLAMSGMDNSANRLAMGFGILAAAGILRMIVMVAIIVCLVIALIGSVV